MRMAARASVVPTPTSEPVERASRRSPRATDRISTVSRAHSPLWTAWAASNLIQASRMLATSLKWTADVTTASPSLTRATMVRAWALIRRSWGFSSLRGRRYACTKTLASTKRGMLPFPQSAADPVPVRQLGVEVHLRGVEVGGEVDHTLGVDLEALLAGHEEDHAPSEMLLSP